MTTRTRQLMKFDQVERLDLLFTSGAASQVASLKPGQTVVIGREAPAHVRLDAEGLSRRHARIGWDDEGPFIEDLGSTNGTKLNGQKVSRAGLAPGDVVSLGDVRVSVVGRREGDALLTPIDSYDAFVARVEHELARARLFQRSFGLLRLHPLVTTHVSRFAPAVVDALRPVDRVGAFASGELLALLPEADEAETRRLGKRVQAMSPVELGVSTGVFPGDGADAQALLAVLSTGARTLKKGQTLAHSVREVSAKRGPVLHSEKMRALFATARRVAASSIPVMINGETGSGKEVLSRAVHDASPRAKKPFVAINCAAIVPTLLESTLFGHEKGAFTGAAKRSKGLFEQADGGTVFLDEVGELSPSAQAALLRVLETHRFQRVGGEAEIEVDVRVVAATHKNLERAVLAGTFRADLRFRLEGVTLTVPPLRERTEEIAPLCAHFLAELGARVHSFSPEAAAALEGYAWPGNLRELRNVVERAAVVAAGERVELSDLPENVIERRAVLVGGQALQEPPPVLPPETGLAEFVAGQQRALERRIIREALLQCGGNQTKAAKLLKLPLRTLVHKLKALELR